MHEMALAQGVLDVIEDHAARGRFRTVKAVWLEIGALSGVEPEAIAFCFDAVTRGSIAEGARLEIVAVPGRGVCLQCGHDVPLRERFDACPDCGGYGVQPREGLEMRVKELEVD
ncbi:MAG TPA: hydrogenase maturation nickel metallochaperone HypA [Usitatibacter sp.]|nr:hydrogenase maturation nickel metallochaperone HypA [Usitatibacter sp.]